MADELQAVLRIIAQDETGDALRSVTRRVEDVGNAFSKLAFGAGIEEALRRSFTGFAQVERNMERLQFSTKATDAQMRSLSGTIEQVARTTGQTTENLQQSFQRFFDSTSQPFEAATEQFKILGQLSEATGANMDELGRAAASAVNNLKVPQQEVGDLLRKWAVEVPASMMGSFAQVAPRLTQALEAMGFTGQKSGEQIAQVFVEIARATGSPRQAMMEINQMLGQLGNASTKIGGIMFPVMQQIKAQGGSIVDVLVGVDKELNAMGANNIPREFLPKILGVDYNFLKALDTIREHLPEIMKRIKEGVDPAKALGEVLGKTGHDSTAAINEVVAALDSLKNSFGGLIAEIGTATALKDLAATFMAITKTIQYIKDYQTQSQFSQRFQGEGGGLSGTPSQSSAISAAGAGAAAGFVAGMTMPMYGIGPVVGAAVGGIGAYEAARRLQGKQLTQEQMDEAAKRLQQQRHPAPHMQEGGIVSQEGLYHLAEGNRAEAVIPLHGGAGASQQRQDEQDNTRATRTNTEQLKHLNDVLDDERRRRGGGGGTGGGGGGAGGGGGGGDSAGATAPGVGFSPGSFPSLSGALGSLLGGGGGINLGGILGGLGGGGGIGGMLGRFMGGGGRAGMGAIGNVLGGLLGGGGGGRGLGGTPPMGGSAGTGGAAGSGAGTSTGGPASIPTMEGDDVGTGRGHGGRFNLPAGSPAIPPSERETVTLANGEKVTVAKRSARQFQGFFNDLIKAGAPVHGLGGIGTRPGNPSEHPAGMAVDWSQRGRNIVSPDVQRWISANPQKLSEIEQRWGMSGGESWSHPDTGHFSVDTLFGSKHLAQSEHEAGFGGTATASSFDERFGAASSSGGTSAGAAGEGPNQAIAQERARVMKQLQEPGMRELTASVLAHEQGEKHGRADVLEALVNRSVRTGKHPRDLINSGFYGPVNSGAVQRMVRGGVPQYALKDYDYAAKRVGAGSDVLRGMDNQGEHGTTSIRGEGYGYLAGQASRDWAARHEALARSTASSMGGLTAEKLASHVPTRSSPDTSFASRYPDASAFASHTSFSSGTPSTPVPQARAASADDQLDHVISKLPEGMRSQAHSMLKGLPESTKKDLVSGKLSVSDAIDKHAPFGMGSLAKTALERSYPGGIKGIQSDIASKAGSHHTPADAHIDPGLREREPHDVGKMLDQHRQARAEMEKPIRMSVEAPRTPNQVEPYRRRTAQAQGRMMNEGLTRNSRHHSYGDIGVA